MIFSLTRMIVSLLRAARDAISEKVRSLITNIRGAGVNPGTKAYSHVLSFAGLRDSELVFAEKDFTIHHPLHLAVRVDRVYDKGSSLVLLELKTRIRRDIYPSDIIELSAQRLAVSKSVNREVSEFAYVLMFNPVLRTHTIHQVRLYPDHIVIGLARRRELLIQGAITPNRMYHSARCEKCEYRPECGKLASSETVRLQSPSKSPS